MRGSSRSTSGGAERKERTSARGSGAYLGHSHNFWAELHQYCKVPPSWAQTDQKLLVPVWRLGNIQKVRNLQLEVSIRSRASRLLGHTGPSERVGRDRKSQSMASRNSPEIRDLLGQEAGWAVNRFREQDREAWDHPHVFSGVWEWREWAEVCLDASLWLTQDYDRLLQLLDQEKDWHWPLDLDQSWRGVFRCLATYCLASPSYMALGLIDVQSLQALESGLDPTHGTISKPDEDLSQTFACKSLYRVWIRSSWEVTFPLHCKTFLKNVPKETKGTPASGDKESKELASWEWHLHEPSTSFLE